MALVFGSIFNRQNWSSIDFDFIRYMFSFPSFKYAIVFSVDFGLYSEDNLPIEVDSTTVIYTRPTDKQSSVVEYAFPKLFLPTSDPNISLDTSLNKYISHSYIIVCVEYVVSTN